MRPYFTKLVEDMPDSLPTPSRVRILDILQGLFDSCALNDDERSAEAAAAIVMACAAVSRMPEPKASKKPTKKKGKKK